MKAADAGWLPGLTNLEVIDPSGTFKAEFNSGDPLQGSVRDHLHLVHCDL
jgi:hypothetical protein